MLTTLAYSQSLLTHTRVWHTIDAAGQPPGRLATQIVQLLQGKYKPVFHPGVDSGDHVVVTNAKVWLALVLLSSCCSLLLKCYFKNISLI